MAVTCAKSKSTPSRGSGWRSTRRNNAKYVCVALAVLLFAFVLRLIGLDRAELGMDGGLSLALAWLGPREVFLLSAQDVHPPLFYLLLHYWMLAVGTTPFAAKYLSLIFGLLSVAVVSAIGRRFGGPRLGILAAVLMAVSPLGIVHSAEVRDFIAAGFFAALSTFTFFRALDAERYRAGDGRWGAWLAFAFSSVAGLLTSYLLLGVVMAHLAYVVMSRDGRRRLKPWIATFAAIGVLYAPWGWIAIASTLEKIGNGLAPREYGESAISPWSFAADALRHLTVNEYATFSYGAVTALCVAVPLGALALATLRRWRGSDVRNVGTSRRDGFLSIALVFSLVLTYAIAEIWLRLPLPSRYLVVVLPFFLLLVARGLVSLAHTARQVSFLALAGLVVVGILSWRDFYLRPPLPPSFWDPQRLVAYLDANASDGDGLIFITLEQAGYYASLSHRHLPWDYFIVGPGYFERGLAERVAQRLPELAAKHDVLWLAFYQNGIGPGSELITGWLNRNTFPGRSRDLSDTAVRRYGVDRGDPPRLPVNLSFGGKIKLLDAGLSKTATPGGEVRLSLTWKATGKMDTDYVVFVHFLDDRGERWAQKDAAPLNGEESTSQWRVGEEFVDRRSIQLPENLPPGRYWLDFGLYAGDTRLQLANGSTLLRLGPVKVP
ncbi:MAG: glycosyltransferase family 39 protein [Chloroflexi bacterium]|nr:glycosyltransferase family 39 protein [Chloroflexota bacterium]